MRRDSDLADGNEARDAGRWCEAAMLYRRYLEKEPMHFSGWVQLGNVLREDGRPVEALVAYSKASGLRPGDSDLEALVERLREKIGIARGARPEMKAADGQASIVTASEAAPATAAPWFQAPRLGRKSLALALARGDAARDRRVWILAIEHYRAYLRRRPKDFGIWVQLGHALKEAGRHSEALDAYRVAESLQPDDADLLLSLGHLHKVMGDRRAMGAFYRRSFERDGNDHARRELEAIGLGTVTSPSLLPVSATPPPMADLPAPRRTAFRVRTRARTELERGLNARDRRNWAAAAQHYSRYLAARPRDFAIWVQMGHALKEAGQLQPALEAYSRAYRLNGRDADLLLNLGHLHKVMGDPESASVYYQRSLEIDGNSHARGELSAIAGKSLAD